VNDTHLAYVGHDTWPRVLGLPEASGVIRQQPSDFQVEEILGFDPDGAGEHLWLMIEKTGWTTVAVQQALARHYAVSRMDVAYSGLKDKYAVTRQWFSIRTGMKSGADVPVALPEGITCLKAVKNSRKLRRGVHKSNRFTLVVTGFTGAADIWQRLDTILARGVPNYFGPQRFGRGGRNIASLLQWWQGTSGKPERDQKSILLSAGRSYLFNRVLARRVEAGNWDKPVEGDCFVLAGSASTFRYGAATLEELQQRLLAWDIHPTGPMWGRGNIPSSGEALALETLVTTEYPALCSGLLQHGLEHARRSLRLQVQGLEAEQAGNTLTLRFELVSGSYATAVLRELMDYRDAMAFDA